MARNSAAMLIMSVLCLCALGIVMLLSVSAFAPDNRGNAMYFITRQSVWLVAGLIGCIVVSRMDYHFLARMSPWVVGLGAVLILACFVPGLGRSIKGAHRWLLLGPANLQPSELVKLSVVLFGAWWLGMQQERVKMFTRGILVPGGVVLALCGLLVLQPDLGTAVIIITVMFLLMLAAGARILYLLPIPVMGVLGILGIALTMPERRLRILAFLNPEAHRADEGYQIWQSLIALGSGGISGLGLGNSVQKMKYVPEAHTDLIFAIMGEELGLCCTLLVVLLFLTLALSGGCIAVHAPDATGLLMGLGAVSLICIQAGLNMAVVTAMVPAKGLGLPFISYGGSNLLLCFLCIGILLSIHRQAEYDIEYLGESRTLLKA